MSSKIFGPPSPTTPILLAPGAPAGGGPVRPGDVAEPGDAEDASPPATTPASPFQVPSVFRCEAATPLASLVELVSEHMRELRDFTQYKIESGESTPYDTANGMSALATVAFIHQGLGQTDEAASLFRWLEVQCSFRTWSDPEIPRISAAIGRLKGHTELRTRVLAEAMTPTHRAGPQDDSPFAAKPEIEALATRGAWQEATKAIAEMTDPQREALGYLSLLETSVALTSPVSDADRRRMEHLCTEHPPLRRILAEDTISEEGRRNLLYEIAARWQLAASSNPPLWEANVAKNLVTQIVRDISARALEEAGRVMPKLAEHAAWFLASHWLLEDALRMLDTIDERFNRNTYLWLNRFGALYRLRSEKEGHPLPVIVDGGPLPPFPAWQQDIAFALDEEPVRAFGDAVLPLARVVPMHGVKKREGSLEKLNSIIAVMALRLSARGWRPGELPDDEALREILLGDESGGMHLPAISQETSSSLSLLLNGHHRVMALVLMVAYGLLPGETLHRIPFERFRVSLTRVLRPTLKKYAKDRDALDLSWERSFSFNAPAAELARRKGATQTVRDLGIPGTRSSRGSRKGGS